MGPNIVEPFHFRVRQLRFLSGSHIAMEFQIHLALLDRSATRSQNLGVDCMDQDWDTHAPQHWHFLFGWSIIIFIRILPHYITLHHITSYYIILPCWWKRMIRKSAAICQPRRQHLQGFRVQEHHWELDDLVPELPPVTKTANWANWANGLN